MGGRQRLWTWTLPRFVKSQGQGSVKGENDNWARLVAMAANSYRNAPRLAIR